MCIFVRRCVSFSIRTIISIHSFKYTRFNYTSKLAVSCVYICIHICEYMYIYTFIKMPVFMRAHVYLFDCNHIYMTIPKFTGSSRTRPSITQPSAKFCSPATIRASRWLMPTLGCKKNSIFSTQKCRATLRTLSRYLTEFVSSVAMCVTERVCERESRFLRETNQQFFEAQEFGREGFCDLCGDVCHKICVGRLSVRYQGICVYIYVYVFICVLTYVMPVCMYISTYMFSCIYIHKCSHVHVHVYIYTYVYVYVYV